jgi:TolB-like protein/DNA-binding winged helix-turn-helix (wHTH) protein/Tfp pilus assembly protein PilF
VSRRTLASTFFRFSDLVIPVPAPLFKFGPFELDRQNFELRRDGQPVKLDRTPLELLFFLVEKAGTLVTRQEAVERVWGQGVFIEAESSLYTAVRKIRRALEDDIGEPQYIQTVSRKGYRFIAKVEAVDPTLPDAGSPSLAIPARGRTWKLWASAAGILIVIALLVWASTHRRESDRVMLVVLPLQNFSGDSQQDYLADGITEEIITELGSLDPKHLGVIARTSAMQYKQAKKDVAQVSRELGVGYVLEGSIRRSGNNIRVTVQLIRSSDQTHLWAQSYDGDLGDVVKLESNIALEVAGQIRLALSDETHERLKVAAHVNPEAHDAYLRGLQGWNQRNPQGFHEAIVDFTRATELAPDYAAAFAQLSRVYSLSPIFAAIPADEAVPKALDAANHALSLDETLADAHTALAFTKIHYLHDWTSAEKDLRRAVELEPNNPYAHFFYSNSFLSPLGRHDEAIAEIKKAVELDPLSTRVQSFAGRTYIYARRYDDALAQFQRVNQLDPNFALNHERLAHLYAMLGKFDDAITEESKARTLSGEKDAAVSKKMDKFRQAVASRGAFGYWQTQVELAATGQNPPEAYAGPLGLAVIYCHLGNKEKAFANLEEAYREREEELTNLAVEPQFDFLRSDSRFTDLLTRVGIPNR